MSMKIDTFCSCPRKDCTGEAILRESWCYRYYDCDECELEGWFKLRGRP